MNKPTITLRCSECDEEFELYSDYRTRNYMDASNWWCCNCFIKNVFVIKKGFIYSKLDYQIYIKMAYDRYPSFNENMIVAELL